jgi:predicted alpha/beta hydrolase family esterase
MTSQVLFVQGGGAEGTHDEWDNKLVESLERELGPDYEVRYPRMPNEAHPAYGNWKRALEKEFTKLNDGAVLVGHSIGGTILINALAEDRPALGLSGVFLIAAPFVGENGWPSDDIKPRKKIGAELPEGMPVYLYHGSKDDIAPFAHVDLYAKAIPQAVVRRLKGRNHQLDDDLSQVARDIMHLS